jgi:hypothetical protein
MYSVIVAGGVYRSSRSAGTAEELRGVILSALRDSQSIESLVLGGRRQTAPEIAAFVEAMLADVPRPLPIHLITGLWRYLPAMEPKRLRKLPSLPSEGSLWA